MGAADDDSPDRHRGSPKRRRHDSRSPSRKDRRQGAEAHQHRSRHERDRSREHSREHSSRYDRHYDEDSRRGRSHRHVPSRDHTDRHQQQFKDREQEVPRHQARTDRTDRGHRDRDKERERDHDAAEHQQGRGEGRREYDKPRLGDSRQGRPREQPLEGSRGPRDAQGPSSRQQQQQQRRPGGGRGGGDNDGAGGRQRWGKPEEWAAEEAAAAPAAPREQPNMGLSGKLAAESNKTVDGTAQLKYQPPPEARVCKNPPWRLYVFKGQEEAAAPFTLNQTPYYLFGKDRKVADIPTDHPSCSRQHAVLCFREVEVDAPDGLAVMRVVKPYIIDLESINGTHLNGEKVEAARYYELLHQDVIKFGLSSREYVIMNEAAVK